MSVKEYKPTTSSRRKMSTLDKRSLSKKEPNKKITTTLKKNAGRDKFGKISIRHRGGGAKRKYRIITSLQDRLGIKACVKAIEYDPNRNAHIALIEYQDKKKAYIISPHGLKANDIVEAQEKTEIKIGNRLKLKNIPSGTVIYDVELVPGQGGKIARGAGTQAVLMSQALSEKEKSNQRLAKYVHVKMPSSEIRLIHNECYASIGNVSNYEHSKIRIGKAGRMRWLGRRPSVRGKAMNPVDHPHGGGEGHNPIGLKHPKTPWGKPALGYRTRKNKRTNKFIVKRRK